MKIISDEMERRSGEVREATVAELAEMAFHAAERVKMLSMMNTPSDYEERKKAFIELAEARANAMRTRLDLEAAIGGGNASQ